MVGRKILILGVVLLLIILSFFFFFSEKSKDQKNISKAPVEVKGINSTKVKYPVDYTLVLVGDSMTEVLGNSDELRKYFKEYYPNKTFEILNYGFGSTNILSLPQRLTETTFHGRDFRPITDIDFDLIIIESFGHNPLSEFPLKEGLKKQTETLDQVVDIIKQKNPRAKLVFTATISPNKRNYARGLIELTPEKRAIWVEERISYIKNHIDYAKSRNIPLINVFEKSLNKDGDGNMEFINSADFIHLSPSGVYLISRETADFIYKGKLLN